MTQRKIALSIEEAADYTGIGRNTLRKLVEWKKLPVLKVGRKVLIKTDMLVLPPLFGGQIMIWWSMVLARVFSAILAFILIKYCEKGDLQYGIQKI